MRICLIGGSGFVGARLAELLIPEHEVRILDTSVNETYLEHTVVVDVLDPERLEKHLEGQDLVVLLTAEHRDDVSPPSLYYDVNVQGTKNVLEAMTRHGIRSILFTSSVAVYGLGREEVSEEDAPDPVNHYGKSKFLAEEALREWQCAGVDRSLTIIRPTVIFGEGNRANVYRLLKQIASRRFLMLGDGENKKSMCYADNVTRFLRYCVETQEPGYRLFNYADKPDLSMNELVRIVRAELGITGKPVRIPYRLGVLAGLGFDLLAKLSGRSLPISSSRIEKFCATTTFATRRLAATPFRPPFSLQEAISSTLRAEFPLCARTDPREGSGRPATAFRPR